MIVLAVVALLLYMWGWVWLWPASYLAGWWPAHDARLEVIISQPGMPTPSDVFSKYAPHTVVKLTHLLPSGVWSLCGALQLLTAHAPHGAVPRLLHRASGWVMLLCSVLIVVGYVLMEARGLVTNPLAAIAADATDGARPAGGTANPHHASLRLLSAWFAFTAVLAAAAARRGRHRAHRRWALRHLAAGGWVIVQRLMVLGVAQWAAAAGVAFSEARRRELFSAAASAAVAGCLGGAELYLLWRGAT